MPVLADSATFRFDRTPPDGLSSYPAAEAAWLTAAALRERQARLTGEFTRIAWDGRPGWKWRGNLTEFIWQLHGPHTPERTVAAIRRFLADTGNLIPCGGNASAGYWLPLLWQDISPATAARLAAEAAAEAERAATPYLQLAPPPKTPETLPLDPEDVGGMTPGQETDLCRFCPRIARLADPGALPALRRHERDDHPAEYWGQVTHVCVLGDCGWGAPDAATYKGHLAYVHKYADPAAAQAFTAQAARMAARLRTIAGHDTQPAAAPAAELTPAAAGSAVQLAAASSAAAPVSIAAAVAAAQTLARYIQEQAEMAAELNRMRSELAALTARAVRAERLAAAG